MKKLDIVAGTKYGRLTIIKEVKQRKYQRYVKTRCECGTIKEQSFHKIKCGDTISCGCFAKEIAKVMGTKAYQRNLKPYNFETGFTPHNFVDGDNNKVNKTECYYIARLWQGIKQRCYNPNEPGYKWYGARGIEMYKPWIKDRQLFKQWILDNLGHRPEGYSIDRINVNGNYEPNNLRWADKATQLQNRRCTKK
jgi:hypothetical protein